MEKNANKENKKQVNKDFLSFVKTKKAKLLNDPLNYDSEEDFTENPFECLKNAKNVSICFFNYSFL